jgi:phosphoribosylglycinamide formyltransferase-1
MRIAFLASHKGSNLQALLDACRSGEIAGQPVVVVSNNESAYALERARAAGIPAEHLPWRTCSSFEEEDIRLLSILRRYNPDLVVCAGYMRKVGAQVLAAFPGRVVNIHPALLPKFGGQGMYGMRVHQAVLEAGETKSGATVHVVSSEYDEGPILAQRAVEVRKDDTPESLAARVLEVEHSLYVETVKRIAAGEIGLPSRPTTSTPSISAKVVSTPNFDSVAIPVEFVVIHYTACSLERAFEILCSPVRKASAHLVIDRDGSVTELVPCLSGPPLRAWHAGKSRFSFGERNFESLNDCSVGIELVNYNGNVFPFTDAQYGSLNRVLDQLRSRFPVLCETGRIIGHEEIAGWRGKADPGVCFDWSRIGETVGARRAVIPESLVAPLASLAEQGMRLPDRLSQDEFFSAVSSFLEATIGLLAEKNGSQK